MVNTGLIVVLISLLLLLVVIKLVNKFGVIRKKLPQLEVKRNFQASGNIRKTQEYCVQGKCFKTKPLALQYAEQVAKVI